MPGFFARLFSKKSKLTKEQVLLSEVIKYCLSKNFFTTVTAFLQKGDLSSDDAKGDGTQTGQSFKIEHIVAHKAFTDEFEKNLEAFIVTKGSTVEDFAEICRAAIEDAEDPDVATFIDVLFMALDFQVFFDLAQNKEKRSYFFTVLNGYGTQIAKAVEQADDDD